MITVAHNLTAYNAQRQFNLVNASRSKSAEKLSSGYRINRAADDAAGLAISEKMRRQINGLSQASRNCQDGIGLCQVKDGALEEVHGILNRMTELSVQSANATLADDDRAEIQVEIDHLVAEINRIGSDTEFNNIKVFDYANQMGIIPTTSSSAIGSGYLTDSYGENGIYYPSANLNFGGVNANTVQDLYNKSFSFTCSLSCNEAFKFTFKGDGTPSSASNLSGRVEHRYIVDISGETTPKGVLDKLFSVISEHMPNNYSNANPNDMLVSHSNRLVRTSDTSFSIVATSPGFTNAQSAQNYFAGRVGTNNRYAKADCTEIAGVVTNEDFKPVLKIQAGAEKDQYIFLTMNQMNAAILGLDPTDVSTQTAAGIAISKIKEAFGHISEQRSTAGAEQNRLEHAIKNLDNVVENTTNAESRIRDTDMAGEMVDFSIKNIMSQAGTSMMSQANQSNASVLSLLQ